MGNGGGGRDKKAKRYDDDEGGMDQGRGKDKKKVRFFYFDKEKIRGPTKFEVRTPTIPQQRR